ncbi:MAG: tyrosine-type recombinase/integrase [Desulfitobacteriaceae bacterium]|jgi:site-specific recombinase XerD|nr:tyrosine-type recombinase/integrase [Desulfitobacteriaceae bacterium]
MKDNSLSYYVQNYFLSYLISQRGYGDNTVASYRDTFKLLFMFLESGGKKLSKLKLTDISQTCVLQFLEWAETERHNAVSTRNLRLAVLKSFFGYVLSTSPEFSGQCTDIINIPAKRVEKRPPLYLTESETKLLLNAPDGNSREGIRHMAILTLLYDSACRVQELINLNVADVTIGRCCKVFVKGKGSKYREIPIFGETGKILERYINVYGLKPGDALFTNRSGGRLTRAGVSYIMNKYKKILQERYANRFDLSLSLSPHLMRHSKATHLVNENVNIYNVRDFLGHASVITTQVYLTSNPEVTRKAIEKASSKTVSESNDYYSLQEKEDLLAFLETLI